VQKNAKNVGVNLKPEECSNGHNDLTGVEQVDEICGSMFLSVDLKLS